jgi:hypothetical protein
MAKKKTVRASLKLVLNKKTMKLIDPIHLEILELFEPSMN